MNFGVEGSAVSYLQSTVNAIWILSLLWNAIDEARGPVRKTSRFLDCASDSQCESEYLLGMTVDVVGFLVIDHDGYIIPT
jgi:hypothetical protein